MSLAWAVAVVGAALLLVILLCAWHPWAAALAILIGMVALVVAVRQIR